MLLGQSDHLFRTKHETAWTNFHDVISCVFTALHSDCHMHMDCQ